MRKYKGTANIWKEKKLLSKAFVRRWYGSGQEEGAAGNSPASSGALQMNQSQEPLGGSCQWHSPPPPFLPAPLHHGGREGEWKNEEAGGVFETAPSQTALGRKREGTLICEFTITFPPTKPQSEETKRVKPPTPTQSFSFHACPKSPLFIPAGSSLPRREKGKAEGTWGLSCRPKRRILALRKASVFAGCK